MVEVELRDEVRDDDDEVEEEDLLEGDDDGEGDADQATAVVGDANDTRRTTLRGKRMSLDVPMPCGGGTPKHDIGIWNSM